MSEAESRFDRRRLLKYAAGTAAAAALAPLASGCSADDPPSTRRRSNVLVILADDMRYDFLPYMPNVQELLVKPGLEFTQARCNVALCEPCRVSLLTGQWSIHNGVLGQSAELLAALDQDDTVGRWMKEAGYRTALMGKYLNSQVAMTPPVGWDVWRQFVDEADTTYLERGFRVHDGTTTTAPAGTATDYLETETLAFINDESTDPWFLLLNPTAPHYPFEAPAEELEAWSQVDWPIVLETDVSDKPSWIQAAPGVTDAEIPALKAAARGQLAELATLDRSIANIVDGMGPDVLADTVIIFASDNGLNYGEHRNTAVGISKIELYDVSLRVPCVIKGPGITPGTSTAPVSMAADLTATVCAIGGADASLATDGVDLRGQIDPDRPLLASRGGGGRLSLNPHPGDCVITRTQKLMRWDATGTDQYEAYDYLDDPDELLNWANDPSRRAERDALEGLLDELLQA